MSEAQQQIIRMARTRFETDLGSTEQNFDAAHWDITSLAHHLTHQRHVYLDFVRHSDRHEPLPAHYAVMVKCWLLLTRGRSAENLKTNLLVSRILWEAIYQRRNRDAGAFHWHTLSLSDLEAAETLMHHHWAPSTTYKGATRMAKLVSFLASHGICPPLDYRPYTPRQRDFSRNTLAGQEARRAKLPSARALEGLADLYHSGLTEPPDRLRIAAVALLVVTGMRVGELLTLPLDCEVEDCQDGQTRYGLRYHREKSGYGPERTAIRWLSPIQAQLARTVLAEIRELTTSARERARILEAHPDRVPILDYTADDWLTTQQAKLLLGLHNADHGNVPTLLQKMPRRTEGKQFLFRVGDLEQQLLQWRAERLWTLRIGPDRVQALSETLLLAHRGFFSSQKGTCPLLVESLTIRHLSDFLSGRRGVDSIFERMTICEDDGQPCRLSTHQFRHWLNDLADKGGMPIEMLSRWMGRSEARDTLDYRHATVDERLTWLKAGIRHGSVTGFMADVYQGLASDEREHFLDGQIQAVHVTPLGFCVHDFAVEPCPYHLNCLRGCQHYLRTKGDAQEHANLIRVQDITVRALEQARQQMNNDNPMLATAWIQHHEDTLRGVAAALAVDGDEQITDGAQVSPTREVVDGKKK
jgi:hypothetical protein